MSNKHLREEKKINTIIVRIDNLILPLLFSLIVLLLYSTMQSYLFDKQILSANVRVLISLLLIVVSCVWSLFGAEKDSNSEYFSITGVACLFFLQTIISTMLNFSLYSSLFSVLNTQVFWFVCFVIFLRCSKIKHFSINHASKLLIIAFWIYSLNYSFWIINRSADSEGMINALYFGLMLLPSVFLSKNVFLSVSAICVSAMNTLLSGKRTAFFVLLIALMAPVLVELFSKKKKKLLIMAIITVVAILSLYAHLVESFEIELFTRIRDIAADEGSGRLSIYTEVWSLFKESDFLSKLFGHGFNAVYLNSTIGTSAHNDFLEVLYDFGILGLIFYVCFIFKLLKCSVLLYKAKSQLAPMFLSSLLAYLIMSTTSHLIIYPTYIVFLLFFFVLGVWDLNRIRREEMAKNEDTTYKLC